MIEPSRIPTNMRLFYILDILGKNQKALTPTEINTYLGWPKPTVHRLCNSLVEEGFLKYDESGKRLQPSEKLCTIANGILSSGWNFAHSLFRVSECKSE